MKRSNLITKAFFLFILAVHSIIQPSSATTSGTLASDTQIPLVMDGRTIGSMTLKAGAAVSIIEVLPGQEGVMISLGDSAPFKLPREALTPESLSTASTATAAITAATPTPAVIVSASTVQAKGIPTPPVISTSVLAYAGDVPEQPGFDGQSVWQFRVQVASWGPNGYLWIPPKCKKIKAIIMGTTIVIEKAMLEDPIIREMAEQEDIAIVWFNRNWCNQGEYNKKEFIDTLEGALKNLADVSGYPEIAWVPWVTIGHSASQGFAYNSAYWNPDRVLAVVSAKAGYPLPPKWSEHPTMGETPLLAVGATQFEITNPYKYSSADGTGEQMAGVANKRPPGAVTVGIAEVGSGHFEWSQQLSRYTADFIRAAARARLSATVDANYKFKPVDPDSLWVVDSKFPARFPAAPAKDYTGNKAQAMHVFNKELADGVAVIAKGFDKKPQWIGFECGGKVIEPNMKGMTDLPFIPVDDGMTFHVRAHLLDCLPAVPPDVAKPLGHAKDDEIKLRVAGWGWSCEQVGADKFRIRFSRAEDKIDKIIILATHPGNADYRPIVQPGFITISLQNKEGTAQKITFPEIPDQLEGVKEVILNATSDSGLPVEYFVKNGPAIIKDRNHLIFTPIPVNAKFPVEVCVVAYQWGKTLEPKVQTAEKVVRSFKINRK